VDGVLQDGLGHAECGRPAGPFGAVGNVDHAASRHVIALIMAPYRSLQN